MRIGIRAHGYGVALCAAFGTDMVLVAFLGAIARNNHGCGEGMGLRIVIFQDFPVPAFPAYPFAVYVGSTVPEVRYLIPAGPVAMDA